MIDISYYLNTSKKYFIDLAASLSMATGEEVNICDNQITLPKKLGNGSFEFYELNDGISLVLMDCILTQPVQLSRKSVMASDYYKVLFNIGSFFRLIKKTGATIDLGRDFSESVVFSSNAAPISFQLPKNKQLKTVQIIFHRSWLTKQSVDGYRPLDMKSMKHFDSFLPMQFTSCLTPDSILLAQQLFNIRLNESFNLKYREGLALQLFSIFARNLKEIEIGKENMIERKANHIIQFKEYVASNSLDQIPPLTAAASHCNMSKSTFIQIFHLIYGKNYHAYFIELRLLRATQLLKEGFSLREITDMLGFNSVSYFSNVYKKWQQSLSSDNKHSELLRTLKMEQSDTLASH